MNKFVQLALITSSFFIFSSPAYALQMVYPFFPSPSPTPYQEIIPPSYTTYTTPSSQIIEYPIGTSIPSPTFSPFPTPWANPPQQTYVDPYPSTPPPSPYPIPQPEFISPTPPDMIPMNPMISKISPNKANQGDRVTLTGLNFSSDAQIYVNNIPMPKYSYIFSDDNQKLSFILDTEIQFEINKTYDVYVSNEGGSSNKVALIVTSPVKLEKITPGFGSFRQITQASGKGFGSSTGSLVFIYKGVWVAAPVLSWNDSQILFRVPAVSGFKTYQIQVNMGKQPKGKIAYVSNTMQFDVHEGQPFIQSILPKSAKSGQIVTMTGLEFGNKPGKVELISGAKKGTSATVISWTEDKIQFVIPRLIANTEYQVQVTTRDGRPSSTVYYKIGK